MLETIIKNFTRYKKNVTNSAKQTHFKKNLCFCLQVYANQQHFYFPIFALNAFSIKNPII
ncbi:MAG: hypothetical protein A3F67_03155 [Verrucomicrobia bacterium RIFCSPHIGHO2_12_FULL_41_10]|nr:MAG: hypothetical protein A3F67_03155 [Verrucomicrobia bacterium RIFCSPHIGHO2_12_FULL_41_10]